MSLPPLLTAVLGQLTLSALLLGALTVVERTIPIGTFNLRTRLHSGLFYVVYSVTATVCISLMGAAWARLGVHPLAFLQVDRWFAWSGPFTVVLVPLFLLLFTDFSAYWFHRIQHWLLWPVHAAHHSIEDLHATSSYGHFLDPSLQFLLMTIPMSLLPVATTTNVAIAGVLQTLAQQYIHSSMRFHLGPLRYVITDNRFHRIHHSTEPRHFNRNFGPTFTLWDQLFGTAYFPKPDEWPETGLEGLPQPRTLQDYLLFPITVLQRRVAEPLTPIASIARDR